jgi:hypothetical protein
LHGTNNGFYNSARSFEWTKILPSDDTIDTGCSSSCDEEIGWRIDNGSVTGYDVGAVVPDTNNGTHDFDDATYWHSVNYESIGIAGMVGAETIIDQSVASSEGANFDIELGATADHYMSAGTYQDTLTFTLTTY